METLAKLQEWYFAQCNEDWEHSYGVTIGTLDNPGWILTVDLTDTSLNGRAFPELKYGLDEAADESGDEWIHCQVKDDKFVAAGGPAKLQELIDVFVAWANATA